MIRTSISLDENSAQRLDRIQKTHGYSSRSAAITGMLNDYENAMLQLEILQEYFRVTKGMVNPGNVLIEEKSSPINGSEKDSITKDQRVGNFNKFRNSLDNIPD